jgi:hypothetical protein
MSTKCNILVSKFAFKWVNLYRYEAVGMLKSVAHLPAVKAMCDKAAEVLGYDLLDVCINGGAPVRVEYTARLPSRLS